MHFQEQCYLNWFQNFLLQSFINYLHCFSVFYIYKYPSFYNILTFLYGDGSPIRISFRISLVNHGLSLYLTQSNCLGWNTHPCQFENYFGKLITHVIYIIKLAEEGYSGWFYVNHSEPLFVFLYIFFWIICPLIYSFSLASVVPSNSSLTYRVGKLNNWTR